MEPFYVTLPSNSSMDYYPDNKIGQWRTKLPKALAFPENWEMGLCELMFPANWYNVVKGGNNVRVRKLPKKKVTPPQEYRVQVQGTTPDIIDLTDAMGNELHKVYKVLDVFTYDDRSRRVKITVSEGMRITLSPQLAQALAMETTEITETTWGGVNTFPGSHENPAFIFIVNIEGKEEILEPGFEGSFTIPEGHYESAKRLCLMINDSMEQILRHSSRVSRHGCLRKRRVQLCFA